MSGLVLHNYFRSSTSYRVRIALKLKGLDYAYVAHHLRHGGQRAPEFLAVNPQGLVPALVLEDGTMLSQSLAICEYLDEVHPEPPLLPADPHGRARVRMISQMIGCDIHPVNNLRVLNMLRSRFGADDAAVAEWFRHWVDATFEPLEAILTSDGKAGRYSHGDSVTLATGQVVTLNANGTLDVTGDGDIETVNFTYTVESSTGANDVGFVTVGSVPCFVAGSLIRTQTGRTPVEALRPGDMVLTQDNGLQPVRWVGRRVVAAEGDFAPIRIEAGTLGRHDTLLVSPLHRILVRDPMAHMLFGETEVLIAAKHLVNGTSICIAAGGTVEYVHVLFDRHEIISANGLDSESFLPGAQTETLFEEQVLSEICALFPELDTRTGEGYSPAARRILRGYEARLLQEGLAA